MSLKLDLQLYYRQKKATQDFFYRQGRSDISYTISTLSSSTMMPCIVVACFIGEINGFDEKLVNQIKGLIKFYGYTELLNAPENFPKDLFKSSET